MITKETHESFGDCRSRLANTQEKQAETRELNVKCPTWRFT